MFKGKVAIVTGGGSGIGRSTAEMYANKEARVVVADLDEEGGHQTVANIESSGGQALFVRADVSKPAECQAMVDRALSEYGRLDIACNNAGIGGEQNPTGEYSTDGWDAVIAVNLSGVFYCMKYEIAAMLETGGGAIVNMASILGKVAFSKSPAYVSAKHGMLGLTKNAAVEYAQQGIRINAVGPAFIKTPLIADLEEQPGVMDYLVSLHPMGRLGMPNEVAELVIWLSSEKASFVTGSYYPVDGGYLAK